MTTDERLERIEEKQDRAIEILTVEVTKHDACRAQQVEHHRTLYGNGQPGLVTRIERLETRDSVVQEVRKGGWSLFKAVVSAIVGGVITVVGTLAWSMLHGG